MTDHELTRRTLLAGAGSLACYSALAAGNRAEAQEQSPVVQAAATEPVAGPQAALEMLVDGNRRFVTGKTRHAHRAAVWRSHLLEGQHPIATILGCSDSRVPVELVFDQGFGDLFVVRVAGNVVDPATFGSIGYAVEHLKTPLLVVLGHEQCGAVTAALEGIRKNATDQPGIEKLLDFVKPSLEKIDPELSMTKQVSLGVEANVRRAVEQLAASAAGQPADEKNKFQVVGAVYDLKSGQVRFLS